MNTDPKPVTAVIRRLIKPGREAEFESLMQEFLPYLLRQQGHLGMHVIRTSPSSREYTVFDRFATLEERRRFVNSKEYSAWMARFCEVSETKPEIDEIEGLAFWFTLPEDPGRRPPPKSKMALLTLLGVYPLSVVLPAITEPITRGWHPLAKGLLLASLTVGFLTWLVMPKLTRLFKEWLIATERGEES
jgi:uncharacterized protein